MNDGYYVGMIEELGTVYHGGYNQAYWVGRNDALKCTPGNAPCGDICLPKGKRCKTGAGSTGTGLRQGRGLGSRIGGVVGEAWEGNILSDYRKGGVKRAVKNKIIRNITSYPVNAATTAATLAIASKLRKPDEPKRY